MTPKRPASKVVAELRALARDPDFRVFTGGLLDDAANFIETAASSLGGLMEINQELKAENARLREALGRAYEAVETCDETYPGSKYLNVELKAIRAALAGEVKP